MFGSGLNNAYPLYKQTGLLAALKKINFGNILTNTQKTLNIVNQAIPIVYQVKPMVNNAKTMFKIIGAVKNDNNSENINDTTKTTKTENITPTKKDETSSANQINQNYSNQPQFFI